MIRGPVLPHLRESLWSLVSSRMDRLETGLTLILESLDCSEGELGVVEGLARDAAGGIVLVLLAVEGDSMLPARALSAGEFLARVGDALVRAVPEANFCPGSPGRVLLVGTESAAAAMRQVCSLPIAGLQACMLEPFRIAGRERFAVRWLETTHAAAAVVPIAAAQVAVDPEVRRPLPPEFVVPPARQEIWQALASICERMDAAVIIHGDRYSRSISWNGKLLGEVRTVGSALIASAATGVVRDLRDMRDVHRFGNQLLRTYARHAELGIGEESPTETSHTEDHTQSSHVVASSAAGRDRFSATRHAVGGRSTLLRSESLRSSLAAAKLSPEEYSALGDPASVAGPIIEGPVANDRS